MATRLYLRPTGGTPGITPTQATAWDFFTGFDRVVPATAKTNTAFATKVVTDATATANRDALAKQYVYPLLPGVVFATADTVKGRMLASEGATASNLRSQCVVRVIASDGSTVRATLVNAELTSGTTNPGSEWATTLTNRHITTVNRSGAIVNVEANYTTVGGDYLVIEIGYRKHAAASTTGNMRFGDNAAADLAENETATTDANTWIEFSGDLIPIVATATAAATAPVPAVTAVIAAPLATASATALAPTITATSGPSNFVDDTFDAYTPTTALETANSAWVKLSTSGIIITSTNATAPAGTSATYKHTSLPAGADYTVKGDIKRISETQGYVGLTGRIAGASDAVMTGYGVRYNWNLDRLEFIRFDSGGTVVIVSTVSQVYGSPLTVPLELRLAGGTQAVWANGASVLTASDATYSAAGQVGLWESSTSGNGGTYLDNYVAQQVGAGGTVSAPAATATGAGLAPTAAVSLAAPSATASGAGQVVGTRSVLPPPTATATGTSLAPTTQVASPVPTAGTTATGLAVTVSATANAFTVAVPLATGSGIGLAPTTQTLAQVPIVAAAGSGVTATVRATVAVPVATASAAAPSPAVKASATPPAATASSLGLTPTLRLSTIAPAATATGAAPTPDVTSAAFIVAVPKAAAVGAASVPTLRITIPAVVATAAGSGVAPTLRVLLTSGLATVTAAGLAVSVSTAGGAITVVVPLAAANGTGLAAVLRGAAVPSAALAAANGAALTLRTVILPLAGLAAASGIAPTIQPATVVGAITATFSVVPVLTTTARARHTIETDPDVVLLRAVPITQHTLRGDTNVSPVLAGHIAEES